MWLWAVFAIVLVVTVLGVAMAANRSRDAIPVPSRPEKMLGQRGKVTEDIDPVAGVGRVVVGGDDWAARSDKPLPRGAEVVVDGHDGIVLHVAIWRGAGQ
jgi:membrane protein implicated in regulation of membrane protease activity